MEGYVTIKDPNGRVDYFQFKNGKVNGFGIQTNATGPLYRGEYKDSSHDGYGLIKYKNNDEYDGQWKNDYRHGEGVFKEASTERVERRLYEDDEVKEVLEVIEQGQ